MNQHSISTSTSISISISTLDHHPLFVSEIVDCLWAEWGDDYVELTPYKTRADLERFYRERVCADQQQQPPVCVAYVLYDADTYTLISSVLVDTEDMGMHPHLGPWLANVYTAPSFRGQGNASRLIRHVLQRHRTPTKNPLYLWTFDEPLARFYRRFGFETLDVVPLHGKYTNAIVMCKQV